VPDCPVVHADPTTVTDRIRELVIDAQRRETLGRAGYDFVRAFHGNDRLARRLLDIYRADIAEDWKTRARQPSPLKDRRAKSVPVKLHEINEP